MIYCAKPPPSEDSFTLRGCLVPTLRVEGVILEGGFSTVYKAQAKSGAVAVKRIRLKKQPPLYDIRSRYKAWRKPSQTEEHEVEQPKEAEQAKEAEEESFQRTKLADVRREIKILKASQHKFVVKFNYAFTKMNSFWLVTEYCLGDIHLIQKRKGTGFPYMSVPMVCHLVIPIISAVAHLCSKGFIHFDIKIENILISPQGVPKLADFGIAREYHGEPVKISHGFGTSYFMAPEMYRHDFYNLSYDTWSIGITMLFMTRGDMFAKGRMVYLPIDEQGLQKFYKDFEIGNEKDNDVFLDKFYLAEKYKESARRELGEMHSEFRSFMVELLEFDWKKRLTPVEACELPLAVKFLKSWEEGEKSELFRDNQKELFRLLDVYKNRQQLRNKKQAVKEVQQEV